MNRASLALGLLLGSVAAALIAAGVARDLERAELRDGAFAVAETVRRPHVTASFVKTRPVVDFDVQQHRPLPADPVALLPLTSHTIEVDLKSWMKQFVAIPKFEAKKSDPPLPRVILDRRVLARMLAEAKSSDTSRVDGLIRENDGIDDLRDAHTIPFGHVVIGGRLVKLQHRSAGNIVDIAWTGALHYGLAPRQTLRHADPAAALASTKAEPLPWETPHLWSEDRRAAIDSISGVIGQAGEVTIRLMQSTCVVVSLGQWANDQIDLGLGAVAMHLKREAWLAMTRRPVNAAPVQSAQRRNGGKG